jgi:hypothetical protein
MRSRLRITIVDRKQDWTALLQELIRIPSCVEAEHAIVHRVCEHVAAIGLSPILVPMDASALRLHADTVEPISTVTGVERQLQLDGDLIFQFVLEDEITGNGTLACLEAGQVAGAAIIIDGTRPDRAIDQQAGNLEFRLNVTGRAASTSLSHLGASAAELLSHILQHLRDSFHRLNDAREPVHFNLSFMACTPMQRVFPYRSRPVPAAS